MSPFRYKHTLAILDLVASSRLPLDLAMSNYFRAHKALGSKDRLAVSSAIYTLVRWQGAIDTALEPPVTPQKRLDVLETIDLKAITNDSSLPLHVRCSFPKKLFEKMAQSLGEEKAFEICLVLNERAPLCLRTNLLQTTREELMKALPFDMRKGGHPTSIIIEGRANLFSLEEFKAGHFECQDEGSQIMAALVKAKPGDHVLDMCSGSGGKTLAIAPLLEGTGQLYLYDIRKQALEQAKKRLKRALIQNAQIVNSTAVLYGRIDWVLVDAPCSGTGTLRRNPDLKWKFDEAMLERLIQTQREIFEKALATLKPSGSITFVTCSLLKEENKAQVKYFLDKYDLTLIEEKSLLPTSGSHDGFFGASFRKKSLPVR